MPDPVPEGVYETAVRVLAGQPTRPVEERALRAWVGRDRGTLWEAAASVIGRAARDGRWETRAG